MFLRYHLADSSPESSDNILMAVIGAVITGLSIGFYYAFVKQSVNYQKQIFQIAYCRTTTMPESLSFIGGALTASGVFFLWMGYQEVSGITPFGKEDDIIKQTSTIGFALSGLLVGMGAKALDGGLFEHGYGQMQRKNQRSGVAFLVFLVSGILGGILAGKQALPFLSDASNNVEVKIDHKITAIVGIVLGVIFLIASFIMDKGDFNNASRVIRKVASSYFFSFLLSSGLLISGMARRSNVIAGFCVIQKWSPILFITIAVTAVIVFGFMLIIGNYKNRPFLQGIFSSAMKDERINARLFVGAIAFGLGWGLSGLQLATWVLHLPIFTLSIGVFFGIFMIGGMFLMHFIDDRMQR